MILLKNIRNKTPLTTLSKIDATVYDLVWILAYYDAPLSGLLTMKKELFWFDCINENTQPNEWFRQYAIVKLSNEQLDKQQTIHRDFQKYVGTLWDRKQLIEPPKRVFGQEDYFYDKYSTDEHDYENNHVIGWFEI